MANIIKGLETEDKFKILADNSKYDISCACGGKNDDHRKRNNDGNWIYPVSLPNGGVSYIYKTLMTNVCVNNCKYCPFRSTVDVKRCTLTPDDIVKNFLSYYERRKVMGMFLSSGVIGTPDNTMELITKTARILRKKHDFRGYLHLKVIPGSSESAIEETLKFANSVSINIEVPGENNFKEICPTKDYKNDVIKSFKIIKKLSDEKFYYKNIHTTTQFIVGAARETDNQIVNYVWNLYKKLKLNRIYFSAYQKGLGDKSLPGEQYTGSNLDLLNREHRLYQVDWLIRRYKFSLSDIGFDQNGNLPLHIDPKEQWAQKNPNFFPVDINTASRDELLRVPGIGFVTLERILELRKIGFKINKIDDIHKINSRILKAQNYLKF
jgi:predicted DNA-binding helix-hairpin-helix protein